MCKYQTTLIEPDRDENEKDTLEDNWSCPRDSYQDSNKCIFHLSQDEKSNLDISDSEITNKLENELERKESEQWEFVGASIPEIKLNRTKIGSKTNYPLNLRKANIDRISMQFTDFKNPLDLRGADVGEIELQESSFSKRCKFSNATFHDVFNANSAVFDDDVDFEGCTFIDNANFEETRFYGDTCLRKTVFKKRASFDGVEFKGDANLKSDDACFENAIFESSVSFIKAEFRYADFIGVKFKADVNFNETIFTGDAEFSGGIFSEDVMFRGAEFQGDASLLFDDADFSDTEFQGDVDFTSVTFNLANFKYSSFKGELSLKDSQFNDDAWFDNVYVKGELEANESRFYGDTSFKNAEFDSETLFIGGEFHGGDNADDDDLSFEEATFHDKANFDHVEFGLTNFNSTKFCEAIFSNSKFNDSSSFEKAVFDDKAIFTEARFRDDCSFESVRFKNKANFTGCEFQGGDNVKTDDVTFEDALFNGVTEFDNCEFRCAKFNDIECEKKSSFSETTFRRRARFDGSSFGGDIIFNESRFESDVNFAGISVNGNALFTGAEFDGEANVERDDVCFDSAKIFGDFCINNSILGYTSCSNMFIRGDINATKTTFNRDLEFEDSSVGGRAEFKETIFNEDVLMKRAHFEEEARFDGAEFRGGDNIVDDDFNLFGAKFDEDVSFRSAEFSYTNVKEAEFKGDVYFNHVVVNRTADFSSAHFHGDIEFNEAVFKRDGKFENCIIEGEAKFFGAEFEGWSDDDNDANFNGTTFKSNVNFKRVDSGSTGFDDAEISGKANFKYSKFDKLHAIDAKFNGPVDLSFVNVHRRARFTDVDFDDDLDCKEIRFHSDADFSNAKFTQGSDFSGAEFSGGANTITDADFTEAKFSSKAEFSMATFRLADFSGALFDSDIDFTNCDFETLYFQNAVVKGEADYERMKVSSEANFSGAKYESIANFHNVVVSGRVEFQETVGSKRIDITNSKFASAAVLSFKPISSQLLINMKHTTLEKGNISQPEDCESFYDFTNAVIKEVVLDNSDCDKPLFDHFRFCVTKFDGFDWSSHKSHLAENNWVIHEFAIDPDLLPSGESSKITNPATLENTYLKAKNGAKEFGDRKAAAEFFIREMTYRRKKNWKIAAGYSVSDDLTTTIRSTDFKDEMMAISEKGEDILTRIRAAGKWAGNNILYQTCGYGERLWRIVYVSSVAIFIWAAFYTILPSAGSKTLRSVNSIGQLTSWEGLVSIVQNLYFSTATFITLEYVGSPGSSFARWLASLEAYFGALLIALVVFVLGRRVAW